MWALDNQTPYAAERAWVRDKNGAEVWIVAVKATYDIRPDGRLELAEEQEEVCRTAVSRAEPGQSSLLRESDLVRTKASADVVLNGHAYAPQKKPVEQADVTMTIAGQSKTLRVFGDRCWDRTLTGVKMSPPEPFLKMPLTYERAYGGFDRKSENTKKTGWEKRNPIGCSFAMHSQNLIGEAGPNIELPNAAIRSWNHRPAPAGFGLIARDWSPRVEWAGTYDDAWNNKRRPLVPLDFDDRFFQAAPVDQQSPKPLRGGEQVVLENLTPDGRLEFVLPRVRLGFTTYVAPKTVNHNAQLHTVIIEADTPQLILVWHTSLPCHRDCHKLRSTRIYEKKVKTQDPDNGLQP